MRKSPPPTARPRREHKTDWEESYGMELETLTRYTRPAPAASARTTQRQAATDRVNGRTPTTSLRLHGTRLRTAAARELVLVTLARPDGGFRMVALDVASHATRELWTAPGITARAAGERHFAAVTQLCAKLGAVVVAGKRPPAPKPSVPPSVVTLDEPWTTLAIRLKAAHEAAGADEVVADVASLALDRLRSGDLSGVVVELMDAARVPYRPLADAAGAWLRLVGYDRVHALVPQGTPSAYGGEREIRGWSA